MYLDTLLLYIIFSIFIFNIILDNKVIPNEIIQNSLNYLINLLNYIT